VVPAAASPAIGGAAFRQPVRVIFLSVLDGVLACGAGGCAGVCAGGCAGVCAKMAAVAKVTIAAHVPVQMVCFIIPPMRGTMCNIGTHQTRQMSAQSGTPEANTRQKSSVQRLAKAVPSLQSRQTEEL
jgi:hypothetical protein